MVSIVAEKKEKQYVSDNAQLMAEWDWEKNNELNISPYSITYGSHKEVWWKCAKGHSWPSIVSNRTRLGRGCPYCAGQKPIVGENDLCTTHPELVKEWHPTKNGDILPEQHMGGSHKKVWWICEKGHEWEAQIKSRVSGIGCPYCAGKKVLHGFNDLETIYPELAKEWHPTKNGRLTSSQVTYGSGKKVWWTCKNGHEWEASVCNRTKGRGCPVCSSRRRTSFPEQAIFYYIKQAFPDAINGYREAFNSGSMELDIFIPQINVGIEYDGKTFHSEERNRIRDAKKYDICKKKGITLIRITDNMRYEILTNCDHKITIPKADDYHLSYAISKLLFKLNKPANVDVATNRLVILQYLTAFDTSLEELFPELAKEWNYEKNGFPPRNIHPGSNEKVWWICKKCGLEWKTSISGRTGRDKTDCPICSRKEGAKKRTKTTMIKRGSVADKAAFLLDEWDYEKNKITPDSIPCTSPKKVWWKCKKCGYNWQTSIEHRVKRQSGCPCCRNQVVVQGINDLATTNPKLAEEWNYEQNSIRPTEISAGSSKKVWWLCPKCNHEWIATIGSRHRGAGCPQCTREKCKKNK